jgi:bla regulator protein BlaR1
METAWISDAGRLLQAIGWTLVHSLWQAAIIYALLSIMLKALPGLPSRARYALGLVALGAITVWSTHTLLRHWPPAQTQLPLSYARALRNAAGDGSLLFWLDESMPWLMMAYGLGLGLMLGRMSLGFAEIRRMRRSGFDLAPELGAQLQALASKIGLKRAVAVRQSPLIAVPMVIGMLRPVILLPHSCMESLSPAALEAVLLHELAHIRRADYFVNVLQTIVEAVLFFNPCVRRISDLLRREREHCCDDLVVTFSKHPFEYAAALASLAAGGRQPAFALAANDGRYPLLNRIKRITSMEKKSFRPGPMILVAGIAVLLIAISIACFTPAFAQHKKSGAKSATTPAPPAPPAPQSATAVPAPPQVSAPVDPEDPAPPAPPAPPVAAGLAAIDAVFAEMPTLTDSIAGITREAMRQVDWSQIRRDLKQASKEIAAIDWNAIHKETWEALAEMPKEVDWNEISRTTQAALNEAKAALAQVPGTAAIDWDEMRNNTLRVVEQEQQARVRRAAAEGQRRAAEVQRQAGDQHRIRRSASADRFVRMEHSSKDEMTRLRHAMAAERESYRAEVQRRRQEMAEARQEMEEARIEMEQARQEMEQARRKLEKAGRK